MAQQLMFQRALLNYTGRVQDAGSRVFDAPHATLETVLEGVSLLGMDINDVVAGAHVVTIVTTSLVGAAVVYVRLAASRQRAAGQPRQV